MADGPDIALMAHLMRRAGFIVTDGRSRLQVYVKDPDYVEPPF